MCSIGEDDLGDEGGLHAMIPDNQNKNLTKHILYCKKCESFEIDSSQIATIKLNFREPECHRCFLTYVRHKFRAALGSSKILPKNAEVLIYFNGSLESIVLLDMLRYAQSQNTFKRLHCKIKVLYIDESTIQSTNPKVSTIREFLNNYQFDTFITSIIPNIETPFALNNFEVWEKNLYDNRIIVDKFMKKFENFKSLTSKQDYLDKLRKKLLSIIAVKLNCNYIFLPDFSFNLATKLLTNISLGRGASASSDVSICDDRFENLKFLRPIKDLTKQEIDEYIKVQNINLLNITEHGDELGHSASIQNLTKEFVSKLQKDFSSTVSTVFRTGDKIAPNTSTDDPINNLKCCLCKSNLDFSSKTLMAIEFSHIASINANENWTNEELMDKLLNQNGNESHINSINNCLCHSCKNIFNDCLNPELFL